MSVAPSVTRSPAVTSAPESRPTAAPGQGVRPGRSNARRLRILSIFVIVYLLLALVWWSMLLSTLNEDAFEAKRALLELTLVGTGRIEQPAELIEQPEYITLERAYRRQGYMIVGEAFFLMISLAGGIYPRQPRLP